MSRRKRSSRIRKQRRRDTQRRMNKSILKELIDWLMPQGELFTEDRFHGNIKWMPEQLAQQALIWAWQETRNLTDAFEMTL